MNMQAIRLDDDVTAPSYETARQPAVGRPGPTKQVQSESAQEMRKPKLGLAILMICVFVVIGIAGAQQRISRAVLSVPEAIDALKAIVAKQQKAIDSLNTTAASQQKQIDTLAKDLQSAVAEIQRVKTAAAAPRPGPHFSGGGIVKSGWDNLPGETIIPYYVG